MSDDFNRTIEFHETSVENTTNTIFPTQSDRLRRQLIAEPGTTPTGDQSSAPTHEDFDLIVDNCRRGRTMKSSATKTLLESLERLTSLLSYTREKTFISYLAEINSIEQEPAKTTLPVRTDVNNTRTDNEVEKLTGE